ncbi:MAG: protease modulator HflC [Oscillospiraceae bacterium]|jgi:membrane protease subunit HflC|nr:protease modulator HflC [Oscillospiraceae bacterium]
MKRKSIIIAAICVVAAAVLVNGFFFTLNEDEVAIVQRFGRIVAVYVQEATPIVRAQIAAEDGDIAIHEGAGLKTKIPFIDTVIPYTRRLIAYNAAPSVVVTADKKQLFFDSSAQWRIENPALFYKTMNSISYASRQLDGILYSRMNEKVGKKEAHVLIADKKTVEDMLAELVSEIAEDSVKFGITVLDVRIKRTDVPDANHQSIFDRMSTERSRIAAQYRSEGDEEAIKIRSETDRDAVTITSEAYREAETLMGEGDSEAARVFNEAYGKNPDFFEFFNMLSVYRDTVGENTTMVVPLDSPLAKYLLGPEVSAAAQAERD